MAKVVFRKLSLIFGVAIYSALTTYTGLVSAEGINIKEDGSTATGVTTVNNVDVVNIATPSTGGVSQNRFKEFSIIDTNGAVMNNSLVDGTSSLTGEVQKANANLTGGSASIILNEVTSNKESNLNGTTEIFGDNARYILSNPNGITCDGCGFIRTPTGGATGTNVEEVLLTTGVANLPTTTTSDFPITFTIDDQNKSTLVINAGGLDATNVDLTTLLTRTAEINGVVDAATNQLSLYLGKGTLSVVKDKAATSWLANTSAGKSVNVAIDANSAGAMNAGEIFIQATEDGAGVTLDADLVSTAGITITAAGDIVYTNVEAKNGDVGVKAEGTNTSITSSGNTISSANVVLDATGDVSYQNVEANGGNATVTASGAGSKITSAGLTSASVNVSLNADGDVQYNNATAKTGSVTVNATGAGSNVTANGNTIAKTGITLSASNDVTYNNATTTNGNVTVSTTESGAQITTSGDTTATTGNITWNISGNRALVTSSNNASTFTAGNTILFKCLAGDGTCDIQSQRELIFAATLLDSNANISTSAGSDLTVNANVSNSQGFNSGGNARFVADGGNINITKDLIAANSISLTSALNKNIILNGKVQSGGDISFLGKGHYTHDTLGTFTIGGDYIFDIYSLTNNAILADLKNGSLRVNQLTNNGLIENQAALTLKVDDNLTNTGIIASLEGAVNIGHTQANLNTNVITNSGVIAAIDLTNSQLGQAGLIYDPAIAIAAHTQAILNGEQRSAEDLANEINYQNSLLIAKLNANATVTGVVSLRANTLTNTWSGRISGSDVSITANILKNQGGQILAGRNLNIQGGSLSNTNANTRFGVLTARDNLDINLSSSFTNTGLVDANNISINAPIQNNTGSRFSITSLLGAKLDTSAQINPLASKPWFVTGTGNSQYQFINAFNNTVIDSNLTRLSDAFITSSGANIDANNQMVGDDVYIAELLVNTLRSRGGVPFVTAERDALGQLNTLYNNTQEYMNRIGLSFGQIPNATQKSQIKDPILVFVAKAQLNGDQVYVPQLWMPSSGEGINAQAGRISTQIIAAADLHLQGDRIVNHNADLIAGENLLVEAVDFTVSGSERKWYVDASGQVHYRTSKVVAGDSVLVKLSGNYMQEGGQVLAANQLVVQAKSINVSEKRKADQNRIASFNAPQSQNAPLWSSLLGLGLRQAGLKLKSKRYNSRRGFFGRTRARGNNVKSYASQQQSYYADAGNTPNMMANQVILSSENDINLSRADIRSTTRTDSLGNTNPGSLTLIADKGNINNRAGNLQGNSIYMQAGKSIITRSLQTTYTNTQTIQNRRSRNYNDDDNYSRRNRAPTSRTIRSQRVETDVAKVTAGEGGLVQIAGADIKNLGGIVKSGADILLQAEGSIVNRSLAKQYVQREVSNNTAQTRFSRYGSRFGSRFGARNRIGTSKSIVMSSSHTAVQQASIRAKGDILQVAGNKIINIGSRTSAAGDILQSAKNGIVNKNLVTTSSSQYVSAVPVQRRRFGFNRDDDYGNRNRTRKVTVNTSRQNAMVNSVSAGGNLIARVEDGNYINNGNLSAGADISVSAKDIINSRQVLGRGNSARVINSGRVRAGGDIVFDASRNIIDTAGRYNAKGNILLQAGGDIRQNTIKLKKNIQNGYTGKSRWARFFGGVDNYKSVTHVAGGFNSTGLTSLQAGGDLSLKGSDINAADIQLRGENITLAAAKNTTRHEKRGRAHTINSTIKHDVVKLNSRGNLLVQANNDLTTYGSILSTGSKSDNYMMINAGGDMNLLGVNNETYSYYYKKRKKRFGRSKTTIRERRYVTLAETELKTGGSLLLNVDNNGMRESGNVTLVGTNIQAGKDAILYAGKSLNVLSGVEYTFKRDETHKKRFGGLSRSGKVSKEEIKRLGHAVIESGGDTNLLAAGDINVVAGEITANNIIADAGYGTDEDSEASINIVGEKEALAKFEHKYKKGISIKLDDGFLSVAEERHNKNWDTTETYIGSKLNARGNMMLRANTNINIVGSEMNAANNMGLIAGADINLLAAAGSSVQRSEETRERVGIEVKFDNNGVDAFAGREKKTTNDDLYNDNLKSSVLFAGNQLQLNSKGSINQISSDVGAAGDIYYVAGGNIILNAQLAYENKSHSETIRRDGVSVGLHHNYEQTKEAVEAANDGDDAVSDVSGTLQAIDSVSNFLSGPSASGFAGTSISKESSYESVGAARGSVVQAGGSVNMTADGDLSLTGSQLIATNDIELNAESVNIAAIENKMAQNKESHFERYGLVVAADKGSASIGFGGNFTNAEVNYKGAGAQSSVVAAGRNLEINSGSDLNIIGSDINAGNDIGLTAANDINIRAKGLSSNYEEDGDSGGAEVGVAATFGQGGAAIGVYGSVQLGDNELNRDGTSYRNSHLAAGNNLIIKSGRDTKFEGATADAEYLSLDVGRNLTVASVQDVEVADGRRRDVSGRVVGGAGASVSLSVGYGETDGDKAWVAEQTRLVGRSSVKVRVEDHTQVNGAMLANIDADGNDKGNLTLDTGTLAYSNLNDKHDETSYYANVSIGTSTSTNSSGQEDTSVSSWGVSGNYSDIDRRQINRATIGGGTIMVRDNQNQSLASLNRNTNISQVVTRDEESETNLYVSSKSIDSVINYEDTWNQWSDDLSNYGKNTTKIYMNQAKLAKMESDNAFINFMIGTADKYNSVVNVMGAGGIIPSVENHGGLMAQVPVLATGDMFFYRVEVTITYDKTTGKMVPVYKVLGEVDKPENNDYVSTNGILNDLEDSIRNGTMQTGSFEIVQAYNPSHGLISDAVVESGWDKLMGGIISSGNARDLREFYIAGIDAGNTININAHSQGALLNYRAMDGLDFSDNNNITTGTILFSGAPVNSDDVYLVAKASGFKVDLDPRKSNVLSQSNNNLPGETIFGAPKVDSVSVLLGGNFDSFGTFAGSILTLPILATSSSPHSNYTCQYRTCAPGNQQPAINIFQQNMRNSSTNGLGYMQPTIYTPPAAAVK